MGAAGDCSTRWRSRTAAATRVQGGPGQRRVQPTFVGDGWRGVCWHGPAQDGGSGSPGPGAVDSSRPAPFVGRGCRGGLAGRVRQGGGADGVGRRALCGGAYRRGPVGGARSGTGVAETRSWAASRGLSYACPSPGAFLRGMPGALRALAVYPASPRAAGGRVDSAWGCLRADMRWCRAGSVVPWGRGGPHECSLERRPRPAAARRPGTRHLKFPGRTCSSMIRARARAPRTPSAQPRWTPPPTQVVARCPTNHPRRGAGSRFGPSSAALLGRERRQHRVLFVAGDRFGRLLAQSSPPTTLLTVCG